MCGPLVWGLGMELTTHYRKKQAYYEMSQRKRILERYDGVVWTRSIWLRIRTSGGFL
jgi:hypothetical protein